MMEAEILIIYGDPREASAISEAVSPDNFNTPENLVVKTTHTGISLKASISYTGENLLTFRSTIDDLLSHITLAEGFIQVAENIVN